MEKAFRRAFREGCRGAVLFGTDIPGLSAGILKQAMDLLDDRDLVLGPSTDGGYWLIGLRKDADLFRGVGWGLGEVFAQTLAKARALGLSTALLEPLTDIDTIEDVQPLLPDWGIKRPYLSVIIPALDEEAHIEKTVRHALCREAEVIVVDGGSGDRTRKTALRAGARLLEGPKGRGVQQNLGAAAAAGRVYLFLHADTLLPEQYACRIFKTLLQRKVALGAFRFNIDLARPGARVLEALVNLRSAWLKMPYGDQALFLRREVFQRAGGFPEIPIAEDFVFVRKVRKQGSTAIAEEAVRTSGRRWGKIGIIRTTLINQVVLAGLALRISPNALASIYHRTGKPERKSCLCP
jgi:rSAM/selenodomain-associated transferase 2